MSRRYQTGHVAVALFLAAGLLPLAGCGENKIEPQGPQAAVTYKEPPLASRLGLLEGVLHGDSRSGCLWADIGGDREVELHLTGPYVLRWSPHLSVYVHGHLVAAEGERHRFGGGYIPSKGSGLHVNGCSAATTGLWAGSLTES